MLDSVVRLCLWLLLCRELKQANIEGVKESVQRDARKP